MEYAYSTDYGQSSNSRWDTVVKKGLAQNLKEASLPFPKLLAKLRREAETYAHHARRSWRAPSEALTRYVAGYRLEHALLYRSDSQTPVCTLAQYWTYTFSSLARKDS